jgi:hypothetical protein
MRNLVIATLYSALAFCVISFATVMHSLLFAAYYRKKPATDVGFPFKYYDQNWLPHSDGPNINWSFTYFVYDAAITWICLSTIYFIIKRKFSKSEGA